MNREESTSTTNDLEEGDLEDKSLPSVGKPLPSSKTYVSQLKIWNGIYSQDNILKIFLSPFPFLLSPAVGHSFCWKLEKSELHTPFNRPGFFSVYLECRPCFIVSVGDDLLIHKFNVLPLGVVSICTSTIFTIEYNFTATQIVGINLINYEIHVLTTIFCFGRD